MLNLRFNDFLPQKRYLYVLENKTSKKRKIKLTRGIREFVSMHMRISGSKIDNYLAKGRKKGKPLCREQVYKIFKRTATDLGLKNIGTHSMRKSFAMETYLSTKDMKLVQRELNHKYITTTINNYLMSGANYEKIHLLFE